MFKEKLIKDSHGEKNLLTFPNFRPLMAVYECKKMTYSVIFLAI